MQKLSLRDRIKEARVNAGDNFKGGKLWSSIFRPGSPFRKGYVDSPRNRSYVVMNNVLYHLHPVKVKRHGVRLSYTLCLGGLSFFLFIVLTITGIWLMFYFRPTELAYVDIQNLQTSIAFGSLVRNMHRWGAHLMVLVVFLHMSRVFYHGAYKAPREFNWVIGVILLLLTLLLSFTGYLLPWDQLYRNWSRIGKQRRTKKENGAKKPDEYSYTTISVNVVLVQEITKNQGKQWGKGI